VKNDREEGHMSEANEATLRQAVAAFNDPSGRERYLDLFAPDVVLHGYPRGIEGLEGARSFYSQLWAAFPDARLSVEETVASGDRLAARYTLSGIQVQDFYGSPVVSGGTKLEGMTLLHFRDGQVVAVWQASGTPDTMTRLAARASQQPIRHSASADAAALRWEEKHPEEAL
jgi:predicted ester cyclase